jgi:phosphoglycolate phosphatase-like HAD superfamily hydrolase
MRFAGYIFDVEGTLIDCVPQTILSLQKALLDFGLSIPYDTLQLYVGLDGDQALQLLAPSLDASTRNKILDAKASHYRETYLSGIKAFREVRVALQALKDRGAKIALATDCKGPELKRYLSLLDVSDLLDTMACGDDVEHGKPDPRLVGLALRKLGVPGPQVLMIGDTPYDAEAARGASTAAAGVLSGGFSKEALLEAGCLAVAPEVGDLISCLRRDQSPSSEADE